MLPRNRARLQNPSQQPEPPKGRGRVLTQSRSLRRAGDRARTELGRPVGSLGFPSRQTGVRRRGRNQDGISATLNLSSEAPLLG
eukprot:10812530-Alexandrium_andersonii.AAC.1